MGRSRKKRGAPPAPVSRRTVIAILLAASVFIGMGQVAYIGYLKWNHDTNTHPPRPHRHRHDHVKPSTPTSPATTAG